MRLAISNIAWDTHEDDEIAVLLQEFAIDAIDVAPSKYFPDPTAATDDDMDRVRLWWEAHGIEITGMQSLLFGTTGLNLFGPSAVQERMLRHLAEICRIGAAFGATRLVFGSPRNRDRTGMGEEDAADYAVPFFRQLGAIAQDHGVSICLEPAPVNYGANFMITSKETAAIVARVAHPAIQMQFDTGALTTNGEDPVTVLKNDAPRVGHIHISEPGLVPLGDSGTDHASMAAALSAHWPDRVACIEMMATKNEPHVDSIRRALEVACRYYRPYPAGAKP